MKFLVISLLIFQIYWTCEAHPKSKIYKKFNYFKEPPVETLKDVKVDEKWITQPLDHFDRTEKRTWQMRYYENANYFKPGGPIYIYVGGEWTISPGWVQSGHMFDMGRQSNGILFYTEHRFYGISRPTNDTSVANLKYLNIDQALEDLANFIVKTKSNPDMKNSGVFLVGGSYSATMVSWFRKKYPHLANGSWSSSAPLLAKADFYEYKEVVTDSIKLVGGQECADKIKNGIRKIEMMIAYNDTNRIKQEFRLCEPLDITKPMDVMGFMGDLSDSWSGIVQYHSTGDIEGACEYYLRNEDEVTAYAKFFTRYFQEDDCYDHKYENMIEFYKNTDWNHGANSASRQWLFQTCSEYGWYQTSNSSNQLFGSGFPVNFYAQMCNDLYEGAFDKARIEENVRETNIRFGGMQPQFTKVFSTHGQLDPWRAMGIQEDLNDEAPTTILPLESHCADLRSISPYDSLDMKIAKVRVQFLAYKWLGLDVPEI